MLYSWGQNLSLHPHIHCLMPAVGVDIKGQLKTIGKDSKFLYHTGQVSNTFRGEFLDSIKWI